MIPSSVIFDQSTLTCMLAHDPVVRDYRAARANDPAQSEKILGRSGRKLVYSGDPVADKEGRGKSDTSVRAAEAAARKPNPGAAVPAKTSGTKTSGAKKAKAKPKPKGKKR